MPHKSVTSLGIQRDATVPAMHGTCCWQERNATLDCVICQYYQSTSNARAEALQNLMDRRGCTVGICFVPDRACDLSMQRRGSRGGGADENNKPNEGCCSVCEEHHLGPGTNKGQGWFVTDLEAMLHLLARYLEMRPLFRSLARPMKEEWKINPYLGVFPLVFKALKRAFSAPKICTVLAGYLAKFVNEPTGSSSTSD